MIQCLGRALTKGVLRQRCPCFGFRHRACQLGKIHGKAPQVTINPNLRRGRCINGALDELMPRFHYTSARLEVLGDEPKALSIFGKGTRWAFSAVSPQTPIPSHSPRGTVALAAGSGCLPAPGEAIATAAWPCGCMRYLKDLQRRPRPPQSIEILSGLPGTVSR